MALLTELAPELLVKIILQLALTEVFRFKCVSRLFKDLIDESPEIGYKNKLLTSGMLDNPKCDIPIALRLSYLRRRDDSWEFFKTHISSDITIPLEGSPIYDVSPTTYITGISPEEDGSPDSAAPSGTAGLQSIRLPTMFDDDEGEDADRAGRWRTIQLKWNIVDFAVSLEENDLMACVASSPDTENPDSSDLILVLLKYSTQEAHNLAERPIFCIGSFVTSDGEPSIRIEVSGENLVAIVDYHNRSPRVAMHIFNWKTGQRKTGVYFAHDTSVTFLREDILMCTNAARNSLDIYHIPSSEAFALNPPPPKTASGEPYLAPIRVRTILALQLPPLLPECYTSSLFCRSSPNPTASGKFPPHTPVGRPYANDPAAAIIFLLWDVVSEGDAPNRKRFTMIVHRNALLEQVPWEKLQESEMIANALRTRRDEKKEFAALAAALGNVSLDELQRTEEPEVKTSVMIYFQPWKAWGPPVTRWFKDGFSLRSVACTSGQRCLQYTKSEPEETGGEDTMHILDFNQWAVKRAWNGLGKTPRLFRAPEITVSVVGMTKSATPTDEDEEEEAEENVCPTTGVFASDLVGRLPYVRCTSNKKWDYDSALLIEQAILGVQMDPTVRYRTKSICAMYIG